MIVLRNAEFFFAGFFTIGMMADVTIFRCCISISLVELILKSIAMGFILHKHAYLRDPWNWYGKYYILATKAYSGRWRRLDFVVVILGYAWVSIVRRVVRDVALLLGTWHSCLVSETILR